MKHDGARNNSEDVGNNSDAEWCPICATSATSKHPGTPYWTCPNCACWWQSPAPAKTYIAKFEGDPEVMSEADKAVNRGLAAWLFKDVMKGEAGLTLDIGAKFPVLARAFKDLGNESVAMEPSFNEVDARIGVTIFGYDFETDDFAKLPDVRFNLITLVHCFEHMYDPIAALRKLRQLVADDGRVFIRLPDHGVSGFERDLTPGHFSIHPFYHSLTSILEALVQTADLFVIETTSAMEGFGQRDIVLRPILCRPQIACGMIVKNEERDLPRCLDAIDSAVDFVAIVDTGSTDRTREIIAERSFWCRTFTKASALIDGDWKLHDFARARNEFVDDVEASDADWLLWMDADDELVTPKALARYSYFEAFDVFGCWIEQGGHRWIQHRMWKTGKGIHFKGRCHEYPVLDGMRIFECPDVVIRHDATPGSGESSNARNLRILMREWQDDPTPRTAFYIANTHKDGGRFAEAVEWYDKRILMDVGFRDEWLFAHLYGARCLLSLKRYQAADDWAWAGLIHSRDWHEFTMVRVMVAYLQGDYSQAITLCNNALDQPIPPTVLWREPSMYRDQPARIISWCYEHSGDIDMAIKWADEAANRIGHPDAEWQARTDRLKAMLAPKIKRARLDVIALHRPGAIGDILMTLNLIPALREANPGKAIWYFCDPRLGRLDALGSIMLAAGVDQVLDCATFEHASKPCERAINLVGYPLDEGYPEVPMRKHLIEYFSDEMGLEWHGMPSLALPRPDNPFHMPPQYATLQVNAGWSRYKEWPKEHWRTVRDILPDDIKVLLIDESQGRTLAHSIALIANATIHLGIDSFGNHLTNYLWTTDHGARKVPGVILWGSTQASASGYASNTNISLGLPCQPCFREAPSISRMPRGPCINPRRASYDDPEPHACMAGIGVDRVRNAVRELWERQTYKEWSNA